MLITLRIVAGLGLKDTPCIVCWNAAALASAAAPRQSCGHPGWDIWCLPDHPSYHRSSRLSDMIRVKRLRIYGGAASQD